ncbi:hypothetical protein C8R44DRAFT_883348 [Mycena epipterygia]|nr:hypothetical protein C8R44DRAFT_883348 [Mycena epipterygia]
MHTSVAALFLSIPIYAYAQTVTLFAVSPFSTAAQARPTPVALDSVRFTAEGVGADGATTYIEIAVESGLGLANPSATSVLTTFSPVTLVANFIADASGYVVETPVGDKRAVTESCRFSNGVGTCVLDLPATTTTFSGTVVPLVATPAATTSTPHNSARSIAGFLVNLEHWGVFCAMMGALFHIL